MKKIKILYNPFERYSENQLLVVGFIGLFVGSLLGFYLQGHFDGVIDLHFGEDVELWMSFIENLISVFCVFLLFSIIGKFLNQKTRFIDILAMSLIARLPLYLIALTNVKNLLTNATDQLMPLAENPQSEIPVGAIITVLILSLISILLLVWVIVLLYNGFKIATHAKKRNLIAGFVLALILAEAISKLIFIYAI